MMSSVAVAFDPIFSILDQIFVFHVHYFYQILLIVLKKCNKDMLLPQLPELPQSEYDLKQVLFPKQHGKIPLEKKTYFRIKRYWPLLHRWTLQATPVYSVLGL